MAETGPAQSGPVRSSPCPCSVIWHLQSTDVQYIGEAVSRALSVERRVSAAPVSSAPQLIITNYLG